MGTQVHWAFILCQEPAARNYRSKMSRPVGRRNTEMRTGCREASITPPDLVTYGISLTLGTRLSKIGNRSI